MKQTNNKGFQYAYTPQFIAPEYKFVSDWIYKKMLDGFKKMRAGRCEMKKGKEVREFRKMKYFVAAFDQNEFTCWEMQGSPTKNEYVENSYAHIISRTMPDIGLPEYIGDYEENPEIAEVRLHAMQTAIVQLHMEGEFEGLIDSYPCEILLGLCNEIYNEGSGSELFLTITSKNGETPSLEDMPAVIPETLLCTDYCNDTMYNHIFSYELKYNKKLILDGNSLKRYDLEKLHLPTGKIVASDPFAEGEKEAFLQTVAPGEYESRIYLDKNNRIALAAVFFTYKDDEDNWKLNEAIRWEPARTSQSNEGYTVTSGFGSFMDAETLQDISKLGQIPVGVDEKTNQASYTIADHKNVLLFRSGIGPGTYSSVFGYDNKNRIICLVTDFHIIDRPQEDIPQPGSAYDPSLEYDNTDPKPFLYFGAGAVSDYYKLDISIKFLNPPTKKQLQQITNNVPEPLNIDSFCDVDILDVNDFDSIYNAEIEDYYGSGNKQDLEKEDSDDTEQESNNSISEQAMRAFENRFNKWLFEVHAICPIQFVIRGKYDKPSKHVTPSHWHQASMKQLPALLQNLSTYKCTELRQRNGFSHLMFILFAYAQKEKINFPVETIRYSSPRSYIYFLIKTKKFEQLKKALESETDETTLLSFLEGIGDYFCDELTSFKKYATDNMYTLGILVVDTLAGKLLGCSGKNLESWAERWLIPTANGVCYKNVVPKTVVNAILRNDDAVLQRISDLYFSDQCEDKYDVLQGLQDTILQEIHPTKNWELALRLYEYTLVLQAKSEQHTDSSIFCNALYVCLNDNTGLPVDNDRNRRFLELCLPHADDNLTVYYNAACVHVDMKEYDKALECLKKYYAKREGDDDYDYYADEKKKLLKELKADKVFDEFRKYPGVTEFIKSIKK